MKSKASPPVIAYLEFAGYILRHYIFTQPSLCWAKLKVFDNFIEALHNCIYDLLLDTLPINNLRLRLGPLRFCTPLAFSAASKEAWIYTPARFLHSIYSAVAISLLLVSGSRLFFHRTFDCSIAYQFDCNCLVFAPLNAISCKSVGTCLCFINHSFICYFGHRSDSYRHGVVYAIYTHCSLTASFSE